MKQAVKKTSAEEREIWLTHSTGFAKSKKFLAI